MPTARAARGRSRSAEHDAALALSREQGRRIRTYLRLLEAQKPRRGRPRTPATVRAQLDAIARELPTADALRAVRLRQARLTLEADLARMDADRAALAAAEEDFVTVAAAYSARKGLTYRAWRAAGVPSAVLVRAGITWEGWRPDDASSPKAGQPRGRTRT
jgi:hypothetical protein